jgi:hypothetical protein
LQACKLAGWQANYRPINGRTTIGLPKEENYDIIKTIKERKKSD